MQRDGLALASVRARGQQPGHGSGGEPSQGRLALGKVVVQKRRLVVAFDDAAAQEEIDQPHSDDLITMRAITTTLSRNAYVRCHSLRH